jgi:hypothetical protein
LRDLAALLHALSRAATAAVAQRGTRDGAERLAPLAAAWLDVARRAVLDGYWTELDTAPTGADLLPDRTAATAWLAVFEADRAARALLAAADRPDDWPAALTAAAQRLLDH